MRQYIMSSQNSKILNLTSDGAYLGKLTYPKWYSLKANVTLADNSQYQLAAKKRWSSKIELKQDDKLLSDLKMGWKGIIIKVYFDNEQKSYLLKIKNIFSRKYILIDSNKKELLTVDTKFKWTKFRFDYEITATDEFEVLHNKEILLFTVLYGINYHISITTAAAS